MPDTPITALPATATAAGADAAVAQSGSNYKLRLGEASLLAIAGENEVLQGTSGTTVVTPVALKDLIDEFRKELGAFYGSWTQGADTTISNVHNGTTPVTNLGNLPIRNNTSFNITTGSIPADPGMVFVWTTCLGLPQSGTNTDTYTGTIRGGILLLDGNNVRWFIPTYHPLVENAGSEGNDICFYWNSTTSRWVHVTYKDALPRTSITACPDDNKWYLISPAAHDEPSGTSPFQDEFILARRNGRVNTIMRAWYDSSAVANKCRTAVRSYQIPVNVTRKTLVTHSGQGLSAVGTDQTLPNSEDFTNYDAIMIEACVASLSNVCYASPMYMREYLTSNTGTEMIVIRYDADQYIHASIESDTTYRIRGRTGLNLKAIIGINFT